jgi:exosortase/archaeosortase
VCSYANLLNSEREDGTSTGNSHRGDRGSRKERVTIWHTRESASRSSVGFSTEIVAACDSIAFIGLVEGVADIVEDIILDKKLSAITSVDAIIAIGVI